MGIMLADAHRGYAFCTQMGGEGAPWIGMAPFVERDHMFQNLGDGTYFHSGQVAITACVAAGINITFKLLYNSAVAMTGGQQAAGALPVPELTKKLEAEGVKKIAVLAEDPEKYDGITLAANAEVRHRDDLPDVMRELEKTPGVTVIIYDQRCAAEKRRLRTRGKLEEPTRRLVINEEVCEGCGDCVTQSNCMSLHPVQTEFGQKMRIHQSSCNKDYSCLLGDCPSFVTVNLKPGTGLRKRQLPVLPAIDVSAPRERAQIGPAGYRILAPGIGGTGVVTVNALLANAALMDGLSVITLDQTGLAQKGGAVVSHLILSREPLDASARINTGNADLLLGFDVLGAAAADNLKTAHADRTVAVINTAQIPTGDAIRKRLQLAGPQVMIDLIDQSTRAGRNVYVDASRIAEALFGTHMSVNLFLTGVTWQAGLIPISQTSIEEAIRLNGIEVERNLQVFTWGRHYYEDPSAVQQFVAPSAPAQPAADTIEYRRRELAEYQNEAYAQEFVQFVRKVDGRAPELRETVARYLYKLMANKDEYEVARLLTRREFRERLREQWESVESIEFNLHPPLLRAWGVNTKLRLGQWFVPFLRLLARLKFLRGTVLDIFGYSSLRKTERSLPAWYRDLVDKVLESVTPETMDEARHILSVPDQIRGYEQIRQRNIESARALAEEKLERLRQKITESVA
jgi:indolepyruvate ferredoxin oxidoreductase